MKKNDSKYFNTASLMNEALLYLLEKKDFEFITVKEICKKAGVHRSTFYLHYDNTDDLLEECLGYIGNKFLDYFTGKLSKLKKINNLQKEELIFLTPDYLCPYLTFIKDNKRIFKTIHNKPHLFNVEKEFAKMCNNFFHPILDKFHLPHNQALYIFEFFTKGCMGIIMKWVENDCLDDINLILNTIIHCANINNRPNINNS